MRAVLDEFGVILRMRTAFEGESAWDEVNKHLSILKAHPHFLIDDSWQMQTKNYALCDGVVCQKSSVRNTFPLLSLCPSLVLSTHKALWPKDLGLLLSPSISPFELLASLHQIKKENHSAKISKYRDKNAYNFGKSSQWLACFMIKEFHL